MRARNRNLVAATAAVVCLGLVGAPVAVADDAVVHTLGQSAELVNGDVVQAWTIKDLKPSSDVIPYQVVGTLWEATATDSAVRGTVQPIVSNLNARARSGQTYRVLFGVATPQGVNPAALVQGQQTTGKVYFDVTGDVPDSVVYNAGGSDLAVWVQPPPALRRGLFRPGRVRRRRVRRARGLRRRRRRPRRVLRRRLMCRASRRRWRAVKRFRAVWGPRSLLVVSVLRWSRVARVRRCRPVVLGRRSRRLRVLRPPVGWPLRVRRLRLLRRRRLRCRRRLRAARARRCRMVKVVRLWWRRRRRWFPRPSRNVALC